ncbi:MAG: hypothetical protein JJ899_17495 [Alphaproteobacteria bacterium]|nr:hypothetical protein [Alphaproteobacteria bacterium]
MIEQPAKSTFRMAFLALAVIGLAACEEDGPAEELGERIDNTAEELKEAGEAATDK